MNATRVVAFSNGAEAAEESCRLLGLEVVKPLPSSLGQKPETLVETRVELAAHRAFRWLEDRGARPRSALLAREVQEIVERWLSGAGEFGFFRAIREGSLTREQYVYAQSNVYQFVRYTTRIAAHAVACSPTTEMRSHFIHHLNGEVNHELIIERDLDFLGEDVAYVRDHMAPNGPTQEFMAIQASLIGFHQDPVALLASPLVAEGVSAHLDEAFAKALTRCVGSWGIETPKKACMFWLSHMKTDGGDDGHWQMTIDFLERCLVDERVQQWFVTSMRSAMRATERMYNSFVDDLPALNEPSRTTRGPSPRDVATV